MWSNRQTKGRRATRLDTLIGRDSELRGDLHFRGGVQIDGKVVGNVRAPNGSGAVLSLSEQGKIEGEVTVPNIVLNGEVVGDVYAEHQLELLPQARIRGSVYYGYIEIAKGAEVNGNLIRLEEGGATGERELTPPSVEQESEAKS